MQGGPEKTNRLLFLQLLDAHDAQLGRTKTQGALQSDPVVSGR